MTDELRAAIRNIVNDALPDRASDEQLLRETLAVLKPSLLYVQGRVVAHVDETDRQALNRTYYELSQALRNTITKLEQRLLEE